MLTETQFAELLSIVDEAAGRKHSDDGTVATTLRRVLYRHEQMIDAPIAWTYSPGRYDDWLNDLVVNTPESWDGDGAQESIVTDYVHELERRVVALGGTLERWTDEPT